MAQGLTENGTRSAYIEAHEATGSAVLIVYWSVWITFCIKDFTVIERKAGFVDKEIKQRIMVETEATAVEPNEERCLRTYDFYAWNML